MTSITGSKLLISVAALLAAMMSLLDVSIVNVALGQVRAGFGVSISQIGWISTGYMMANVVIMPASGWFQRRFGYRRYFAVSVALFTTASLLCALSWNLPSLVIFRVLQGFGGGAIIPTSQSILLARYPTEEHSFAGALFGMSAMLGPLLGPALGGVIMEHASWQWIFLINVPLGSLVVLLTLIALKEPNRPTERRGFDTFGFATLAVGMATLQFVLEEGNREGWFESAVIIALAFASIASLGAFVTHCLASRSALVDLSVFRHAHFASATALNLLLGVPIFAGNFLFALYCSGVLGYTPLQLGIVLVLGNAIDFVIMPLVARFVYVVDSRYTIAAGMILVATSLFMNAALSSSTQAIELVLSLLVRSVGLSMVFIPIGLSAVIGLEERVRGDAVGIFNLTRELGGSIGTALFVYFMDTQTVRNHAIIGLRISPYEDRLVAALGPANPTLSGAAVMAGDTGEALLRYGAMLNRLVSQRAAIGAFDDGYWLMGVIVLVSLPLTFFLRRARADGVSAAMH